MGQTAESTLDIESLKEQNGNLTEEQTFKIAEMAMKELDAEAKPKDESIDYDDALKDKEPDEKAEKAADKSDDKAPEKETPKSDDKKSDEKPEGEEKKVEEEKKVDPQAEIEAYAKENQISVEEAREELDHIAKINEKYKGDPKQLSKANLYLQRLYTKNQDELKSLKDRAVAQQEVTIDTVLKAIDDGKFKANGKSLSREEVVDAYRKQYPEITETADDETVAKMAAKDIKINIEKQRSEQRLAFSSQAKDKRIALVNNLSAADSQYFQEVKPIFDSLSDEQVMDEKFSLADMINWAKGRNFDKALKEAEERGYKKGKEEAKILGEKTPIGSGSVKTNKEKRPAVTLSDKQKQRALEMFDLTDMTEEEKYRAYLEIEEATKK